MRLLHRAATGLTAGALLVGAAAAVGTSAQAAGNPNASGRVKHTEAAVCAPTPAPGYATCNAHVRTDSDATGQQPQPPGSPTAAGQVSSAGTVGNSGAYDPTYLQSAYNTPSATNGAGQTVAIVDAYHDPSAASDLSYYRSFFGLSACTTGNGCFKQVDENGGTSYPSSNSGWDQEISLDLDMVSAVCPNCHILLVEAASASYGDLGTAENTAVRLGANVVSNSYGGSEFSSEAAYGNAYYNHPGVAIVASSGDGGYGVEFPAAASTVTAVGGTSLNQATNAGSRNGSETAWSGAGSGCSTYVPKPSWQHDASCSMRTVADVSAVADPNTGVWVYYGSGWYIFGGTSVASPIVGSVFALGGAASTSTSTNPAQSWPYGDASGLNDVVGGSNGSCGGTYLCTAVSGYDGPTGLGTPNGSTGMAAFTGSGGGGSGGGGSTVTAPSAPQSLHATAGNGSVSLSWTAPANNGGAPVQSYDVYSATTSGQEALVTSGVTTTSYSDPSLVNGTTYYYKVSAVNSAGEGALSSEVSATPQASVPLPGTPSLTATTAPLGSTGVNLSWTIPVNASSNYVLYRSTRGGRETQYASVSCTTIVNGKCTWNDTATNSGTYYYYQVAATNSSGTGSRSNQAAARAR